MFVCESVCLRFKCVLAAAAEQEQRDQRVNPIRTPHTYSSIDETRSSRNIRYISPSSSSFRRQPGNDRKEIEREKKRRESGPNKDISTKCLRACARATPRVNRVCGCVVCELYLLCNRERLELTAAEVRLCQLEHPGYLHHSREQ